MSKLQSGVLTVTSTTLLNHTLLLASLLDCFDNKDAPVLVFVNWLNQSNWKHSKSLVNVKRRYKLADGDIHHIEQNSLSNKNATEALLLTTITQLNQYISGKRQYFDLPLDLCIGTSFQQKVWQALQQIPYGQTISYATLAKNIDQPTAFRAVANANGKNPFSIIVPCHRVIASDGSLGGYTGGLDKKQWLLNHEAQAANKISSKAKRLNK